MTARCITHLLTPTDTPMKRFFVFLIGIAVACSVFSQNQQGSTPQRQSSTQRQAMPQRQTWQRNGAVPQQRNGMNQQQAPNRIGQFSPTEYWNQQKAFFTEKAGLTEDEANAFFPLYNELQQKKRELNREARRISRQEGQTEEQARKALDAIADANIKIAQLERDYLDKFEKVLPASKILKVQNAEEQFNSQILKDIQQSRGHQFQQGQQRPGQPQQQRPQFNRSGN